MIHVVHHLSHPSVPDIVFNFYPSCVCGAETVLQALATGFGSVILSSYPMIISRIYRVFNVNVLHHIPGGGDFMTRLHTIDADTLQTIAYEPISFLWRSCCLLGCTCWREHRRSASPGWRCGCASRWLKGNHSGTSPLAHVKSSISAWRTASSASKAASSISPRTHPRRYTSP